jgi:hypothetical protein
VLLQKDSIPHSVIYAVYMTTLIMLNILGIALQVEIVSYTIVITNVAIYNIKVITFNKI